MKFVIVTGLSGAGKSMAVNALEDIGFFCIDNIPVALLPRIVDFALQGENQLNRVAVVMDVRGVRSSEQLEQALSDLDAKQFEYEILFLDANDAVIQRRYKETRRRHPLGERNTLLKNITCERELLDPLREKATHIIDTSTLTTAQLKAKVTEMFGEGSSKERMGIVVRSFGFKHGLPLDSDLVLDVRFLPNPFYVEELRNMTGNDRPVADFICRYPQTFQYLKLEEQLLDFLVPQYINEGKAQLVISVGCTGGQHRSVFIANKLYEYLREKGYSVDVTHRDIPHRK